MVFEVGGAHVELDVGGRQPGARAREGTTSATVELSLPDLRSSHSASGFGLSAP